MCSFITLDVVTRLYWHTSWQLKSEKSYRGKWWLAWLPGQVQVISIYSMKRNNFLMWISINLVFHKRFIVTADPPPNLSLTAKTFPMGHWWKIHIISKHILYFIKGFVTPKFKHLSLWKVNATPWEAAAMVSLGECQVNQSWTSLSISKRPKNGGKQAFYSY